MPDPSPAGDYRSGLISALTRVLGEWTAPDFLRKVAAREGLDLDAGAITMITILANHGAQRPSALSENMVTGASNVSKILARLVNAGLAVRVGDPVDARAQLVKLTSAGQSVADAFVRAGNGLVDDLLHDWSEKDRREFTRLLQMFKNSTISFSARLAKPGPNTGAIK